MAGEREPEPSLRSRFGNVLKFSESRLGSKARKKTSKQPSSEPSLATGTSTNDTAQLPLDPPKIAETRSPGPIDTKSQFPVIDLWCKAEKKLQERSAAHFEGLQRLKIEPKRTDLSGPELNDLLRRSLEDAETKREAQKNGAQRYLINAGYILATMRGALAAPARFDPTGATSVAVPAMLSILDVALAKAGMDQTVYRDIEDVFNRVEACYYKEAHVLTTCHTQDKALYDEAETALVALYTAVLEYLVLVRRYLDASFVVGTVKAPVSIREIQDLKKDIDIKHKTSDTKFEKLKWAKELSEANGKIWKWITDQDMLLVHRDLVRRSKTDDMHKTAGRWLLASDEFQDWDSGVGLKVFWLCGTAGTGKTTLCSKAISHYDTPARLNGQALAYVYCSGTGTGVKGAIDCYAILNSLIRQLSAVKGHAELVKPIRDFHAENHETRRDSASLYRSEQEELLAAIFALSVPTYVVIDALDECQDSRELLMALRKASESHHGKLRIFLTSRDGVGVKDRDCFPDVTKQVLVKELTKTDMYNYIHTEVFDRPTPLLRATSVEAQDVLERLCRALLEQANGMFKWAQLKLHLISHTKDGRAKQYPDVSDLDNLVQDIRTRSLGENHQLDNIWSQILDFNAADKRARKNAIRAFKLVLGAFYPLTYNQLKEALQIEDPTESNYCHQRSRKLEDDYVPSITQNFLVEVGKDREVEFAHMSAVDFLRKQHLLADLNVFTPLDCHTDMMHMCLYFVRSLPGPVSHKPEDVYSFLNESLYSKKIILRKPDTFLIYAYWNWTAHCAAVLKLSSAGSAMVSYLTNHIFTNADWREPMRMWYGAMGTQEIRAFFRVRYNYRHNAPSRLMALVCQTWAASPGLFIASSFDLPELADTLVYHEISRGGQDALRCFNREGQCLLSASCTGNSAAFEQYLKQGTWDLQRANGDFVVPEQPAVFRKLLDLGADPHLEDSGGNTPVLRISRYGNREHVNIPTILATLSAHGAAIDRPNTKGHTVLHLLAEKDDVPGIEWLLKEGADINIDHEARPLYGSRRTPLSCAVRFSAWNAFLVLLKRGAKIHIDFPGDTPWHVAIRMIFVKEKVRTLIEDFPDFDTPNDMGRTPLLQAIHMSVADWTRHFLRLFAERDPKALDQRTLAFAAVARQATHLSGSVNLFFCLRLSRVRFDLEDECGLTPLMMTASRLDIAGLRCLLYFGCDVNATDRAGRTALHYSVPHPAWIIEKRYDEIAEICQNVQSRLLEAGADPNHMDCSGKTYRDYLRLRGLVTGVVASDHAEGTDDEKANIFRYQQDLRETYMPKPSAEDWITVTFYAERMKAWEWEKHFEMITVLLDLLDIDLDRRI